MVKHLRKLHFQPKLVPTLISFFVLCFFIALGCWQVHRYHVKQNLLKQYQKAIHAEPLILSEINKFSNLRFRQLRVSGHYLNNKTMLLQNRIYQKRIGFDVLTPLIIAGNNKALLINRGWVPASRGLQAPHINPVNEKQTLTGYIKPIDTSHFTLGKNILNTQKWPLKMQKVDIKALSELTGLQFYPFVLRLAADQANGFGRHWQPINLKIQHHLGYAAQWFLMALVFLIGYFFISCHRTDKE